MEAVYGADYDSVKLLLGLDPTVLSSRPPVIVDRLEDLHGRTALLTCGLDPRNRDRLTLDRECVRIAKALYKKGANMSHVDNDGWDAVSIGAVRGYTRFCRYLISNHKVNPNRKDATGRTSLMKAAAHGHFETFHMLLNYSADPFVAETGTGMTAVHFATAFTLQNSAQLPFLRNITAAIVAGTKIIGAETKQAKISMDSFKDKDGRTPLMYAAISNNLEVCDVLLTAGADPRLRDAFNVVCSTMPSDPLVRARLVEAGIALTLAEHKRWLKRIRKEFDTDL